jgi:hypothetical protein
MHGKRTDALLSVVTVTNIGEARKKLRKRTLNISGKRKQEPDANLRCI